MAKQPAQLTSIEHGCFDTAALQQELAAALEEDRKYKLTDNMKKRAIHTAANYDEFKNMVACADLKPVTQKELRDLVKTTRPTNLFYSKPSHGSSRSQNRSKKQGDDASKLATLASFDEPPASALDFCRCWKRSLRTVPEKHRYLLLTGPERLRSLFSADLDADLMAEMISVLAASWDKNSASSTDRSHDDNEGQARFALAVVEALAATSRFSLIVEFLDNNQIETVAQLLAFIASSAEMLGDQENKRIDHLRAKFRLPQ